MSITLPTLDKNTQKVVEALNTVTGRRVITIQARTVADLVTPSKNPNAVKRVALLRRKMQEADCYPWATGGATADSCGLLKFARVKVQVGDRGLYEFLVNCLWNVIGKDDDEGNPRVFTPTQDAFYDRVTRVDGTAYPWAIATPQGEKEPRLYLPMAIVTSHSHFYQTTDGVTVPNDQVDGVWTKPERIAKTQEITVGTFVRWRAYLLSNIASIENIGDELTEGECIEEFREAVQRYADSKGISVEKVASEFNVSKSTVEKRLDEHSKKAGDEDGAAPVTA